MKVYLTLFLGLVMSMTALGQYDIEVTIDGLTETEAYLGYHLGESKYLHDTSAMAEGNVIFKGDESLDHGIYFIYTPSYFLEFVVTDEQEFKIQSNTEDPLRAKVVTGSEENELFRRFQLQLAETQTMSKELKDKLPDAANREDSTAIYEQMNTLEVENRAFQDQLAEDNPNTFVATLLSLIRKPKEAEAPEGMNDQEKRRYLFSRYKARFFDGIDFNYSGILRTPLFRDRILEYIDRLSSPEPDSLIKEVDFLAQKAEGNDEVFRYVVVTLTNKFAQPKMMGHDAIFVHLAEKYYLSGKAFWADEEVLKNFQEAVDNLKPNLIGEQAPSLQLLDTTLSPIALQDIDAKYTVLFFYDPDCGHCKKQAPEALDFYHEYRNEGVEAIGVCIATDMEKWKKFISEKSLDWINGADPYFQSNFRKEYNILSTPTIYVLDKDKKIIGKRLGVAQLSDFIQARLRMEGD